MMSLATSQHITDHVNEPILALGVAQEPPVIRQGSIVKAMAPQRQQQPNAGPTLMD
jgi:hypothetical protein